MENNPRYPGFRDEKILRKIRDKPLVILWKKWRLRRGDTRNDGTARFSEAC
jgi:hypothetical protein